MAYFRCTTGGSGKGNTLVVTCADDLAGATITCTNGTKTYRKTCPSTSPYEVTFYGLEAGTWTVSATVSGNTYTTTVVITDYEAELGGFSWRAWVDLSKNYTSSDFTDLDDLLSDETAIRELMTIHACVDYLAGITTTNADVETIIGNDLCAKWINNRDYALDTLYANTIIADYMDTADKYFYGEWVITDNTTTPPTWGPKGNVPVMTADTAPYGIASASGIYDNLSQFAAWHAFDNNTETGWVAPQAANQYIIYKFTNPTCVKRVHMLVNERVSAIQLAGSYDGTSYEPIETVNFDATDKVFDVANTNFYLYYKITVTSYTITPYGINIIQFYGRELSVSVPKMATNTTPYGEANADSEATLRPAYKAFDGGTAEENTWFTTGLKGSLTNKGIEYTFTNKMIPKMAVLKFYNSGSLISTVSYKFQGYNGTTWEDLSDNITDKTGTICVFDNTSEYETIRLFLVSQNMNNSNADTGSVSTLQFYGLDYSEKEFEEGTTKKWLYDHGVELEELTASGYSISGVTLREAIKEPSQIYFDTFSSDGTGFTFMGTGNAIDLTDYSYLMIRSGNKGKARSNNANLIGGLNVKSTKSAGADGYINIKDMYYVNALDVSSFNQSEFATISSGAYNSYYTITEFWLE